MAKTEFSFDLSDLEGAADGLVAGGERIVVAMGQAQLANERLRAKEGRGVDDQKMPAYSEDYARQKQESGRQASVRDLTVSGRTLRSRVAEQPAKRGEVHEVTLTFSDARSKLIAGANQERSAFFGISPDDEKILDEVGKRELSAVIDELNEKD